MKNTIDYNDNETIKLFKSLDLDIETFNEYLRRIDNVNLALVKEFGGILKCKVCIEDNTICIWYSWNTDVYKNCSAYKVGTWNRKESFQDFFYSLILAINPEIGFKIKVNFEGMVI